MNIEKTIEILTNASSTQDYFFTLSLFKEIVDYNNTLLIDIIVEVVKRKKESFKPSDKWYCTFILQRNYCILTLTTTENALTFLNVITLDDYIADYDYIDFKSISNKTTVRSNSDLVLVDFSDPWGSPIFRLEKEVINDLLTRIINKEYESSIN